MLKKRGFTEEDFLVYHPSGALGKGIKYHVEDLMLKVNLPIASENMKFTELIKLISDYRLGMAIIIDSEGCLSGILTDGDIRRVVVKFSSKLDSLIAKDVMTINPKTVNVSDFAASALHLMEKYSITALAVVDSFNKPIGVIHIHDLLKAGVV